MKKSICLIVVVLLLSLSFTPGIAAKKPTLQKTIYVDDDNTNGPWEGTQEYPYLYIQDGINNAIDGDTVFVYSGSYYENVVVDKTINLIGKDKNNTIIDGDKNDEALYVSADNCIVHGFTMKNGYYDTVSIGSSNNILTENIITHAVVSGISIDKPGRNNTISYNLLSNNGWRGINLASSGNTISENIIRNGIAIKSSGNYIIDNTFFNNGISIYYLVNMPIPYPNTVINNTINGKRLVYWDGESNKLIENDAGQIILMKCNNITVENLEISSVSIGIFLFKTNDCHIRNNSISSVGCGIRLYDSSNNTILDNNISFNGGIGILLGNDSNSIISSNVISNNWDGIYMEELHPKPNIICHNKNTIISGNVISSNRRFNIIIVSSLKTHIYRNNITDAGDDAFPSLSISSSLFTKIEQNNFIDNVINAGFTKAYFCHWRGNYWDKPRFLPYPVYGWMWHGTPNIPWIKFDWRPAKEPYDIPAEGA